MYHLTPLQALFIVALFAIIFLTKSAKKSIDGADSTLASLYPEFKDAAKCGYGYLYCKEMKKRDMVFKQGRWVPKEQNMDIKSKALLISPAIIMAIKRQKMCSSR